MAKITPIPDVSMDDLKIIQASSRRIIDLCDCHSHDRGIKKDVVNEAAVILRLATAHIESAVRKAAQ